MTTLNSDDIEKFWIRCFLNPKTDFIIAAIDRAYRDFNRTLHGIGKVQTEDKQTLLKNILESIVSELLSKKFNDQEEFDEWHQKKCQILIDAYKEISQHVLFVGQAQKWINMTFKYLFALGENRIVGISRNYSYFHFPLDNIIQQKFSEKGIKKIKIPWSRIGEYSQYLNYQKEVRKKFVGQIPMDIEFILFNE